jgi:hypothetical protein
MYYGDSWKVIFIALGIVILIFAGLYWHQTLFFIRFLADLVFLNLPAHIQSWIRTLFHIHSAT